MEMASLGNQQCTYCIGTLLFPMVINVQPIWDLLILQPKTHTSCLHSKPTKYAAFRDISFPTIASRI